MGLQTSQVEGLKGQNENHNVAMELLRALQPQMEELSQTTLRSFEEVQRSVMQHHTQNHSEVMTTLQVVQDATEVRFLSLSKFI
jgi:hypothetical protein